MTTETLLFSILLSLLPISELRGAIPFALANGVGPVTSYLICVGANLLVGPLVYGFLATLHRLLSRWDAYRRLFERLVGRAQNKVRTQVQRFGYVGLALFVAIPLPITGAYTGALGAWVLGMSPRRALPAISGGVAAAGLLVTLVAALGIEAFRFFLKPV
jgi:uncharacterized membrane protein